MKLIDWQDQRLTQVRTRQQLYRDQDLLVKAFQRGEVRTRNFRHEFKLLEIAISRSRRLEAAA